MSSPTVELRDGMLIEWDAAIVMDDGIVLRADVFRPAQQGRYPVLMTHGPYAKGLPFQVGYRYAWESMVRDHPDVCEGTSSRYAVWEACDPEQWVPQGYVCIRVDSRGAGRSEGRIDCWSARETRDFHDCIEWAGTQPWSNGKVGLSGISYYAMNQWQVAALRPPHLAAICPFEGASDLYRDTVRHGGILCSFLTRWYPIQVSAVQHGSAGGGRINPSTGESITGPEHLSTEELAANMAPLPAEHHEHVFDDGYWQERRADLARIEVPVLSCGNWGGLGNHLRGNVEGYLRSGSSQKWLEMHNHEHWTEYYTAYGRQLQMQFFDHFLKGLDNGWDQRAPISIEVRHVDKFVRRDENEWPLARTRWTPHHLDAAALTMGTEPGPHNASAAFDAGTGSLTFWCPPATEVTEITGPIAAKLFISSSTRDADLFVTLRAFGPNGREVLFTGATDMNVPLSYGWLRASHRALDAVQSQPYRPYHAHLASSPLTPDEVYELDIEILPTSIVLPKGYRLALMVHGQDFDHGLPGTMPSMFGIEMRGCSVHLHDDPIDRPPAVYAGTTTIHTGPQYPSSVLLPVIPPT